MATKLKPTVLDSFDGFYRPSLDEFSLPWDATGSMANFDVNDVGDLVVRNGYVQLTGSPVSVDPVKALYRYYQKDHDEYWVINCGSDLFTRSESGTTFPWVNIPDPQDETGWTGTVEEITDTNYAGGKLCLASATCSFQFPENCTDIEFKVLGDSLNGRYRLDTGTWVDLTGSLNTIYGLSSGTHTLDIEPTLNYDALALETAVDGSYAHMIRSLPATPTRVKISFRVNYVGPLPQQVYFHFTDGTDNIYIFTGYPIYPNVISVYNANTGQWTVDPAWGSTGTGWHTIEVYLTGVSETSWIKIDGYEFNPGINNIPTSLDIRSGKYSGENLVLDHLYVNHTMVDDFSGTSGWTLSNASFSILTATDGTTTHPGKALCIDNFRYANNPVFTGTTILTGSSDTVAFAKLNDVLYATTKYDGVKKFNGSAWSAITASNIMGDYMLSLKERLFVAGDNDDPGVLYFSALDEPEIWSTGSGAGYIYPAGQDSGGDCTGLAAWRDVLWYFSRSRLYGIDLTGTPSEWTVQEISRRYGCVAPKSIVTSPNALMFMADDGVYSYGLIPQMASSDGSGFIRVSADIQEDLDTIADQYKSLVCGAYYKNRYWLAVPLNGASANNTIFVYKPAESSRKVKGGWVKYTGISVSVMYVPEEGEYGLYAGDPTSGIIYQLDTGDSDNGANIEARILTAPIAELGFEVVKHLWNTYLSAQCPEPKDLTLQVITDDAAPNPIIVNIDSTSVVTPIRVSTSARGRYFKLLLSVVRNGATTTISRIMLRYRSAYFR